MKAPRDLQNSWAFNKKRYPYFCDQIAWVVEHHPELFIEKEKDVLSRRINGAYMLDVRRDLQLSQYQVMTYERSGIIKAARYLYNNKNELPF